MKVLDCSLMLVGTLSIAGILGRSPALLGGFASSPPAPSWLTDAEADAACLFFDFFAAASLSPAASALSPFIVNDLLTFSCAAAAASAPTPLPPSSSFSRFCSSAAARAVLTSVCLSSRTVASTLLPPSSWLSSNSAFSIRMVNSSSSSSSAAWPPPPPFLGTSVMFFCLFMDRFLARNVKNRSHMPTALAESSPPPPLSMGNLYASI